MFNPGLFGGVVVVWAIIFFCLIKGVKSIQMINAILVPTSFIMLIALMSYYIGLNNSEDGKGMGFYLGGQSFPSTFSPDDLSLNSLFIDAYNQVFFSIGVCVGIMYSYGSYNHIKKPVILDTVMICLGDFIFSILAGCVVWGAIGYLES